MPAVIKAVLENPRTGLAHARLIARHHRNPVGLEALCARAAFAADAGVRRWLVRNPQLPAGLFRRLWGARRLMELHKVTNDRDVPEGTRRTAREVLRQRFTTGPAEEKVELILNTEGRSLAALIGPAGGREDGVAAVRAHVPLAHAHPEHRALERGAAGPHRAPAEAGGGAPAAAAAHAARPPPQRPRGREARRP